MSMTIPQLANYVMAELAVYDEKYRNRAEDEMAFDIEALGKLLQGTGLTADSLGAGVRQVYSQSRVPRNVFGSVIEAAREQAKLQAQSRAPELPSGAPSRGPVMEAYRVDNAINFVCDDVPAKFGGQPHKGCGAAPGQVCVSSNGFGGHIPCVARLVKAYRAVRG